MNRRSTTASRTTARPLGAAIVRAWADFRYANTRVAELRMGSAASGRRSA